VKGRALPLGDVDAHACGGADHLDGGERIGQLHRHGGVRRLLGLQVYETGLVFTPEAGVDYGTAEVPPLAQRPTDETLAELNAAIPPQPRHVAVLLTGNLQAKQPAHPA
jgi:phenylalanyl-tRNA synthetase beta chain